jgi:hypothetical protein
MKWENSRMGEEPHPEKIDEGIGQPYTGFPKSPLLTCWRKNVPKPCFSAASTIENHSILTSFILIWTPQK